MPLYGDLQEQRRASDEMLSEKAAEESTRLGVQRLAGGGLGSGRLPGDGLGHGELAGGALGTGGLARGLVGE